MAKTTLPTIPQSRSGLLGFTSCCDAAATFMDNGLDAPQVLCCKRCYSQVRPVTVRPEIEEAFRAIILANLNDALSYEATLGALRSILQVPALPADPMDKTLDGIEFTADEVTVLCIVLAEDEGPAPSAANLRFFTRRAADTALRISQRALNEQGLAIATAARRKIREAR